MKTNHREVFGDFAHLQGLQLAGFPALDSVRQWSAVRSSVTKKTAGLYIW